MRLEGDDQPAPEALAGGAQRGADLLGMVTVVVHHQDVLLLALHLEAAVDAAELLERVGREPPRDAEIVRDGDGGEGVQRVVASRHAEAHRAEPLAVVPDVEDGLEARRPADRAPASRRRARCRR